MNAKYFLALVAFAAAQSSSASFTITVDGETIDNVNRVVIEESSDSSGTSGTGGTSDTSGGTSDTSGGTSDTGGGTVGASVDTVGSVCSDLDLTQLNLKTGLTHHYFERGEGYAFRITGQEGDRGSINYGMSTRRGSGYTSKVVTISPCAGQFDADKVMKNIGLFCTREGKEGTIYYEFSESGNVPLVYCPLDPDKTYYFNIRNLNNMTGEDSCPPGQLCGFALNALRW